MRSTGHPLTNIEEQRVFWPISVNNESTKDKTIIFFFFVKVYLVRTDHSAMFSIVCFRGGYLVWSILYMISGVPDWQWRLKTITIYGWWTFTDWDAASCFLKERGVFFCYCEGPYNRCGCHGRMPCHLYIAPTLTCNLKCGSCMKTQPKCTDLCNFCTLHALRVCQFMCHRPHMPHVHAPAPTAQKPCTRTHTPQSRSLCHCPERNLSVFMETCSVSTFLL